MTKTAYIKWVIISWMILFSMGTNAQTLDWVGSMASHTASASAHNIEPYAMAQDANQDIYVVGRFRETADFDMGTGTTLLSSVGNYDAFVAKYDVNGNFIYAFRLGSTSTSVTANTQAYDIAVDAAGNIIVVGEFRGVGINFAPLGGTSTSFTSNVSGNNSDAFVVKYNSAGQCIWGMQYGIGNSNNELYGVATDKSNNIYITGRLDDNDPSNATGINVNPLGTAHTMNTNGADIVLIKYNASGLHLWDANIGSSSNLEYGYGITISGANLYLTGEFQSLAEFNPLGTSMTRTSVGSYDGFLAQYALANGICNWVNRLGDSGSDEARKSSVDAAGDVYVTGAFSGTVDFDPSLGGTNNVSSSGSTDIFVAKYDASGSHLWAFPIGGSSTDYGYDIDVDGAHVYATGKFKGTSDFDPSGSLATITAKGSSTTDEAYLAKYTTAGAYVNAFTIEGTGHDRGYSIIADNGAIYLTGYFSNSGVDFDPVGSSLLSSNGSNDGFLAAYSDVVPSMDIAIVEWLSDPSGIETEEEWVELYNYGSTTVNLKNWKLKDEDTDNATIATTDLFLAAGESLVLARNKTQFEAHWLKGCSSDKVVQVHMNLDNTTDEIILEDNTGSTIWSVAYANDGVEGRATFYTEATYPNTTFGAKVSPGVSRTGNDATGSLGYQRNNITADANAYANAIGDIGSPVFEEWAGHIRGNTVVLDGVNDYLDLGSMTGLENQAQFTFEAWVKPLTIDANTERIFSKRLNNTNRIEISLGSGGTEATNQYLKISICNGVSETASAPNLSVPVGEWTHIAVSFDGTAAAGNRLKFYANGIQQSLNADPTATTTPIGTGNAHLGKRSDNANKPSNIELDELRLWTVARTAQAIRENMHLTLRGCETGLFGYYQLNESTGTTANDILNNHNATLVNGVGRGTSTVNVGNSATSMSQTITGVSNIGAQVFNNAKVEINVTSKTGVEDWTATYEGFAPNGTLGAVGVQLFSTPIWTINSSNNAGAYIGNLTFTFPTGTFSGLNPIQYQLYHRAMHEGGEWKPIALASSMTTHTISFSNIEVLGQFMVVKESADAISPVRGNMYTFDGIDDYIDMTSTATGLPQGNTARTIEAWIKTAKPTTSSYHNIVSWGRATANLRNSIGLKNGHLAFNGEGNDLEGSVLINDNEWHHLTCVFDGTTLLLYVDGVLDISAAKTLNTTDQNLRIGTTALPATGEYWQGSLEEVRIWSVARTQTEIREHMHLTLKGNETGLVLYYQFNNDGAINTVNGVKDALGLGHGETKNMSTAAYSTSEVAVGGGRSQTMIIPVTSSFVANYATVGISINFGATTPNGALVITRLETETPHGGSSIAGQVDDEYFVVRNYGANTTFSPLNQLALLDVGYVSAADAAQPESSSPLRLYKRPSNAYGATWGGALANANTATSGHNAALAFDNSAAITSFSQIVFANANATFPIDLIKFEAKRQSTNVVALNWATASEQNNKGFNIERMLENETSFKAVAWVAGQGNSVTTQHYSTTDENSSSGISYYRLKQIDTDGSISYSEIRAVEGWQSGRYLQWNIHPNPVLDELSVSFQQVPQNIHSASLKVFSADGKCWHNQQETIQSDKTFKVNFVKDLPAGVYMLSIETNDGEIFLQKFVKQ